jgi:5-methylcytosine-specific restriction endonuclease McrA
LLIADLERAKTAATGRPRASQPPAAGSRHIPAAVRRDVWKRDGGQCAFVGTHGRCTERAFLESHPPTLFELRRGLAVALAKADHVHPCAVGGEAVARNVELRCRAHNLHEAEQYFGSRLPLLVREESPAYVILNSVRTEQVCAAHRRTPGRTGRIGATLSAVKAKSLEQSRSGSDRRRRGFVSGGHSVSLPNRCSTGVRPAPAAAAP